MKFGSGLLVITVWIKQKLIKVWAHFLGANIPVGADFKLPQYIAECRVEKRSIQLAIVNAYELMLAHHGRLTRKRLS